jgi:hypothetical protein
VRAAKLCRAAAFPSPRRRWGPLYRAIGTCRKIYYKMRQTTLKRKTLEFLDELCWRQATRSTNTRLATAAQLANTAPPVRDTSLQQRQMNVLAYPLVWTFPPCAGSNWACDELLYRMMFSWVSVYLLRRVSGVGSSKHFV